MPLLNIPRLSTTNSMRSVAFSSEVQTENGWRKLPGASLADSDLPSHPPAQNMLTASLAGDTETVASLLDADPQHDEAIACYMDAIRHNAEFAEAR